MFKNNSSSEIDLMNTRTAVEFKSSQVAFNMIVASALSYKQNRNTVQYNVRVHNTYRHITKNTRPIKQFMLLLQLQHSIHV